MSALKHPEAPQTFPPCPRCKEEPANVQYGSRLVCPDCAWDLDCLSKDDIDDAGEPQGTAGGAW